jgi:hypothetical protein
MKKIIISVDGAGIPTIDAQGFADAGCKQATAPIEDALKEGGADLVYNEKAEAQIPAASTLGAYQS